MRIISTGDWHLDWITRGVARAEEIESAVHESVRAAVEGAATAYVFLGDLCDPDSGPATFRAIEFAMHIALKLKKQGVPSIWIAGNHDVCNDGRGTTTLTPMRAIVGAERSGEAIHRAIYLFETPGWMRLADLFFLALPFTEPARGYNVAAFAKEHIADRAVVGAHLSVPGIIPGEETNEMPRGREVIFPFAETRAASLRMNGHYHRRQSFDPKDGGPPIEVPGSLASLTFGEERNTPGFLICEVP
jgi:DNA repair exonuclease SbcCD nuclease subunit